MNDIVNIDCIEYMKTMENNSVQFTLTDIPYDGVNRPSNGLRNLDVGVADELKFDLDVFLEEVYRVTKSMICIFCGRNQFSKIFSFFENKKGTARPIVWEKTNPVPMNGQHVYLSGVEFAVWFKKAGAKGFNAKCKNTVFRYPIPGGKQRIHKTQKHRELFKELILDCSNEGDVIFDPCAGGMTTAAAIETNRKYICLELDKDIYDTGVKFIKDNYNIIT